MTLEQFQWKFSRPISHYELDKFTLTPLIHQSLRMGPQIHVHCPHCHILAPQRGPDTNHHCYVSLELEVYHCMRCGDSGSLSFLFSAKTDRQILAHHQHLKAGSKFSPLRTKRPTHFLQTHGPAKSAGRLSAGQTIPLKALPLKHVAWQYLLSEKFTKEQLDDVLAAFRVYYCEKGRQIGNNPANTTTGRLIFEISHEGQIVGWQARWLPAAWPPKAEEIAAFKRDRIQKYVLNPGFLKNSFPYNYDLAIQADKVIAVEGVKKVWKTGPNAIGTFGIQFTLPAIPSPDSALTLPHHPPNEATWLEKLIARKKELYLLFDRNGQKEAETTLEWYRQAGGRGQIVTLPKYGPDDLDDYTREEIKTFL